MTILESLSRKSLPYIATIGISLFTACKEVKTEISDVLHEDGKVVDLVYSPSNHGTGIGPTVDLTGDGGMGIAVTSVDIPEKYAVVFRCQHGKFIIEGTDEKYKNLWSRLEENQEVDITYRERYKITYDDIDNDGKKEPIEKRLIKYDFLDAQPKN